MKKIDEGRVGHRICRVTSGWKNDALLDAPRISIKGCVGPSVRGSRFRKKVENGDEGAPVVPPVLVSINSYVINLIST